MWVFEPAEKKARMERVFSKTWQKMGSGHKGRCEKLRQGRLDSGACNEGVNHKTKMRAGGDKRRKRSGESRKAAEIWFGVCVECYVKEIISCLCCVTAALFLGAEMHCCRLWCGFWFNSLLWDQSLHGLNYFGELIWFLHLRCNLRAPPHINTYEFISERISLIKSFLGD